MLWQLRCGYIMAFYTSIIILWNHHCGLKHCHWAHGSDLRWKTAMMWVSTVTTLDTVWCDYEETVGEKVLTNYQYFY